MKYFQRFTLILLIPINCVIAQCPDGYALSENLIENGDFTKGNIGFASQYMTNVNMILEGAYIVDADPHDSYPEHSI